MDRKKVTYLWWSMTLVLAVVCASVVLFYTPVEQTMGPVQKLFYLHLPAAINTLLACLVCFIASIVYLTQRKSAWDDLAVSAAQVAVLCGTVMLVTGMIWGHAAWGRWWTWSPRLTFSLVLWLLYVVYLMVRNSVEPGQRRAVIAAVYAIMAFLDVPLVYLSVRLMPDIHPVSVQLEPSMKWTLAICFVPITMAAAGLIAAGFTRSGNRLRVQAQEETPVLRSSPAVSEA